MKPYEARIIQIGAQQLYELHDRMRFTIKDILPAKGYYGQFGLRDKIIEEAIVRAKPLEVVFEEREDFHVIMNPIRFKALGKKKNQVGYYKERPMVFYWYNINSYGEVVTEKQTEGQDVLFTV